LYESLFEVAEEQKEMSIVMYFGKQKFSGTYHIAQHIKSSIDKVFNEFSKVKDVPRSRLGSDKWHLDLVSNNVRRFIKPWGAMILSGNFVDDLVFPEDTKEINEEFNVHRYFKLLVKGKYTHYVGNEKIDGYGYNEDSPLFFNLFGLPREPGQKNIEYGKDYLIFIRIIQFLLGYEYGSGIKYNNYLKILSKFFNPKIIVKATKILLWTRIIDEVTTGARDIGPTANFKDIELKRNSSLVATDTTKLYFHNILSEYDYISSMAMVSYQLQYTAKKAILRDKLISIQMAVAAYRFLESWLIIAMNCYEYYKQDGVLRDFCEYFLTKSHTSRPWLKAVEGCIQALEIKEKYAHSAELYEKAKLFKEIRTSINELKLQGVEKIRMYLGPNY
jgi:hypothetical protein